MRFLFIIRIRLPRRGWKHLQVNMYGAAIAARKRLAEQTAQQGDQGDTNQGNAAASHELFYPQIGVGKRLDGGRRRVKKYLWSF